MYDLMRAFGRSDAVTGFVNEMIGTGVDVQGLHVGVDETYAAWYHNTFRHLRPEWSYLPHFWPYPPFRPWEDLTDDVRREIPEWWPSFAIDAGYGEGASPFYIRLILRKPEVSDRADPRQARRTTRSDRGQNRPARVGNYRVVYEERPQAQALAHSTTGPVIAHGDGVCLANGGTPGTCGGALQDFQIGTKYGVTCQHVLSQLGAVDESGTGRRIGAVRQMGTLTPLPSGVAGNRHTMPHASNSDWAIFELDQSATIAAHHSRHGRIARYASMASIGVSMDVEFTGLTSGCRECETGSVGIWHDIRVDGVLHCFQDIFQLRWRAGSGWLNRRAGKDLVQPGDSGAWVISAPSHGCIGAEWFGMIIGGDGTDGYVSFAENILADVRSKVGHQQIGLML